MNCLGYIDRDNGHKRVPDPPDRMTGTIMLMVENPHMTCFWHGAFNEGGLVQAS
jgi:hypothetical protein